MDNNFIKEIPNEDKKSKLVKLFNFLTDITHKEISVTSGLSKSEKKRISKLLVECLNQSGGEVAARERAANIGQTYLELNKEGRKEVLSLLASLQFNSQEILKKISVLCNDLEAGKFKEENIYRLKDTLKSPRITILKQFNFLEQGIHLLVEMREDLIKFIDDGEKDLQPLEEDFGYLLNSWFDVGFLELEEITWDSSASLLQKVIMYEAVHKIQSWSDLENRLDKDRKFYALFHPRMKNVPLIFVEVALMDKVANSVQEILDESAPTFNVEKANTAIFYSISNTQNGLRGISFGNFLIKKVVKELKAEFPKLKNFVTLSPMPRLMSWLKKELKSGGLKEIIFNNIKIEKDVSKNANTWTLEQAYEDIASVINNPIKGFDLYEKNYVETVLKPIIEMLSAIYLLNKDKKWSNDPVLKFHLTNGAEIYRLNWMGDTSENGMKQSLGLMVNYFYNLKSVEQNHEDFNEDIKNSSFAVKGMASKKTIKY